MITSLNHITLEVKDIQNSFTFYKDLLGFKPLLKWKQGAYFDVGGTWFCLSLDPDTSPTHDYTHIAFSVSATDFIEFSQKLQNVGVKFWKDNKSEGESFYLLDPDGHKLELHVGDMTSRLKHYKEKHLEEMVFF